MAIARVWLWSLSRARAMDENPFQAKALRAKAAALRRLLLLPAKVVLQLLASTALREARPATGHHWVVCPIGRVMAER